MLYKNFKRHKIKNHYNVFRIVCDPSSGSIELYLTEIRSGSLMFVLCAWSVFGSVITLPNTVQAHDKHL